MGGENCIQLTKILLVYVIFSVPLASAVDCGGKAFHCVNSTHFMICVDLGGGISSTVDAFVIPCPITTECRGTNNFECEFPASTTPIATVSQSDATNDYVQLKEASSTIPLWIALDSTTEPVPGKTQVEFSEKYLNTETPEETITGNTSEQLFIGSTPSMTTDAVIFVTEKASIFNTSAVQQAIIINQQPSTVTTESYIKMNVDNISTTLSKTSVPSVTNTNHTNYTITETVQAPYNKIVKTVKNCENCVDVTNLNIIKVEKPSIIFPESSKVLTTEATTKRNSSESMFIESKELITTDTTKIVTEIGLINQNQNVGVGMEAVAIYQEPFREQEISTQSDNLQAVTTDFNIATNVENNTRYTHLVQIIEPNAPLTTESSLGAIYKDIESEIAMTNTSATQLKVTKPAVMDKNVATHKIIENEGPVQNINVIKVEETLTTYPEQHSIQTLIATVKGNKTKPLLIESTTSMTTEAINIATERGQIEPIINATADLESGSMYQGPSIVSETFAPGDNISVVNTDNSIAIHVENKTTQFYESSEPITTILTEEVTYNVTEKKPAITNSNITTYHIAKVEPAFKNITANNEPAVYQQNINTIQVVETTTAYVEPHNMQTTVDTAEGRITEALFIESTTSMNTDTINIVTEQGQVKSNINTSALLESVKTFQKTSTDSEISTEGDNIYVTNTEFYIVPNKENKTSQLYEPITTVRTVEVTHNVTEKMPATTNSNIKSYNFTKVEPVVTDRNVTLNNSIESEPAEPNMNGTEVEEMKTYYEPQPKQTTISKVKGNGTEPPFIEYIASMNTDAKNFITERGPVGPTVHTSVVLESDIIYQEPSTESEISTQDDHISIINTDYYITMDVDNKTTPLFQTKTSLTTAPAVGITYNNIETKLAMANSNITSYNITKPEPVVMDKSVTLNSYMESEPAETNINVNHEEEMTTTYPEPHTKQTIVSTVKGIRNEFIESTAPMTTEAINSVTERGTKETTINASAVLETVTIYQKPSSESEIFMQGDNLSSTNIDNYIAKNVRNQTTQLNTPSMSITTVKTVEERYTITKTTPATTNSFITPYYITKTEPGASNVNIISKKEIMTPNSEPHTMQYTVSMAKTNITEPLLIGSTTTMTTDTIKINTEIGQAEPSLNASAVQEAVPFYQEPSEESEIFIQDNNVLAVTTELYMATNLDNRTTMLFEPSPTVKTASSKNKIENVTETKPPVTNTNDSTFFNKEVLSSGKSLQVTINSVKVADLEVNNTHITTLEPILTNTSETINMTERVNTYSTYIHENISNYQEPTGVDISSHRDTLFLGSSQTPEETIVQDINELLNTEPTTSMIKVSVPEIKNINNDKELGIKALNAETALLPQLRVEITETTTTIQQLLENQSQPILEGSNTPLLGSFQTPEETIVQNINILFDTEPTTPMNTVLVPEIKNINNDKGLGIKPLNAETALLQQVKEEITDTTTTTQHLLENQSQQILEGNSKLSLGSSQTPDETIVQDINKLLNIEPTTPMIIVSVPKIQNINNDKGLEIKTLTAVTALLPILKKEITEITTTTQQLLENQSHQILEGNTNLAVESSQTPDINEMLNTEPTTPMITVLVPELKNTNNDKRPGIKTLTVETDLISLLKEEITETTTTTQQPLENQNLPNLGANTFSLTPERSVTVSTLNRNLSKAQNFSSHTWNTETNFQTYVEHDNYSSQTVLINLTVPEDTITNINQSNSSILEKNSVNVSNKIKPTAFINNTESPHKYQNTLSNTTTLSQERDLINIDISYNVDISTRIPYNKEEAGMNSTATAQNILASAKHAQVTSAISKPDLELLSNTNEKTLMTHTPESDQPPKTKVVIRNNNYNISVTTKPLSQLSSNKTISILKEKLGETYQTDLKPHFAKKDATTVNTLKGLSSGTAQNNSEIPQNNGNSQYLSRQEYLEGSNQGSISITTPYLNQDLHTDSEKQMISPIGDSSVEPNKTDIMLDRTISLLRTTMPIDVYTERTSLASIATVYKNKDVDYLWPAPTVGLSDAKEYLKHNSSGNDNVQQTTIPMTVVTEQTNSNLYGLRTPGETEFNCNRLGRGRYSDNTDCRKFYICIGKLEPIVGHCPANTVFSDAKKQCTKNLAHCIRDNEFQCVSEGRFSDYLRENVYYICVHRGSNDGYVRFKFHCQNGFYLDRKNVKCLQNYVILESQSISSDVSTKNTDQKVDNSQSESGKINKSDKSKGHNDGSQSVSSDDSETNNKVRKSSESLSDKFESNNNEFECEEEGRFAFPGDCRKYYVCRKTRKSEYRRRTKKCDSDEIFHKDKKKCVDADSYECK